MAKKIDEQTLETVTETTPEQAQPEQTLSEQALPESATQVENAATPDTAPDPNTPQLLDALAATHRVPTWQQAALERLMGWEDGKAVTDAEYLAALASLSGRKLGGGRA